MQNKIVLITGANSGIGKVTALALARKGAQIIMLCRNLEKGQAAQEEIKAQSGNDAIDLLIADLAAPNQIREAVETFHQRYDRLHVLINNAAIIPAKRTLTADGIEMQFAVNHLAPFLLTNLLLDTLKASAPARVVTVSSGIHFRGQIDFDDLHCEKSYGQMGWDQYAHTKLANVLFTLELARRLEGSSVTANCLHPGVAGTNLMRGLPRILHPLVRVFLPGAENASHTLIHVASSPDVEGVTGKYFDDKQITSPAPQAQDEAVARRLWEVSAEMVGL